jgi:hypothetical protein
VRIFEQVVALPDLPTGFKADTMWALVQLAMAAEQYRKVLDYGNQWLRTAENPSGDPFYLLAGALPAEGISAKTIEMMDRAIEIAERDGKYAREDWYGLLRAALHETNNLRRLRERAGAAWWRAGRRRNTGSTCRRSMANSTRSASRSRRWRQSTKPAGWTARTRSCSWRSSTCSAAAPTRRADAREGHGRRLIQRNERNYRLLAQAWMQAQDDKRSIPPLREAAQRSNDGQLHLQLAQSHLNLYQYNECVEAARAALNRGGLKRGPTGEHGARHLPAGTAALRPGEGCVPRSPRRQSQPRLRGSLDRFHRSRGRQEARHRRARWRGCERRLNAVNSLCRSPSRPRTWPVHLPVSRSFPQFLFDSNGLLRNTAHGSDPACARLTATSCLCADALRKAPQA